MWFENLDLVHEKNARNGWITLGLASFPASELVHRCLSAAAPMSWWRSVRIRARRLEFGLCSVTLGTTLDLSEPVSSAPKGNVGSRFVATFLDQGEQMVMDNSFSSMFFSRVWQGASPWRTCGRPTARVRGTERLRQGCAWEGGAAPKIRVSTEANSFKHGC